MTAAKMKTPLPIVSVLMSNYRTKPDYLRKAIDSLLVQTFRNFEVVVINDGCTDESLTILREYAAADGRIRLTESPENVGLAASLNKGLALCQGKYVARFDTDDICYPDRLEKQVAYMDAHPEMILSGGWADIFDQDEEKIVTTWKPVMCQIDEYRIRLLFGNSPLIIHPTAIFRRELLEKNGIRYSEDFRCRYSEDYRMWVSCSAAGQVGILEEPLIRYRNENSTDRITVRHAADKRACTLAVQSDQYEKLDIDLTDERFALNNDLLRGRKPYDVAYRDWMKLILRQNEKKQIYDGSVMQRLFEDRWYTITYYGIAYDKNPFGKLWKFLRLNGKCKRRFLKEVFARGK